LNKKINFFILFLLCSVPVFYAILFSTWYKEQFTGVFHFFDDSREWLGMDKGGHYITAFVESWILLEWFHFLYGKPPSKWCFKYVFFGMGGFFLQLPIEFMDGYSAGYGFSFYDCVANFLGAFTAFIQYFFWNKIKIFPKVSFWTSEYATVRPNLLGSNLVEQFIKDYNGLTYWYSFSPNLLINKKFFPDWFLISIGYGADGLLGGHDNIWTDKVGEIHDYSHIPRVSFFYLSIDIDFQQLPIKNTFLRTLLKLFCVLKVTVPSWEF
jgi:hypothetical protein